jgi:prepilin signal peptidase PulO-like enzyme (type II secretory pathway)
VEFWLAFFSAIGLIVGSFLNVVVCRHGTGRSLSGRSGCLSCGKKLGPLELVPVLSWLAQGGRCRRCGARISWRYPLVELGGALAFALAYRAHPFLAAGAAAPVVEALAFAAAAASLSALVAIVAYDLRHKIIPDTFSLVLGLAALARIAALGIGYGAPAAAWWLALAAGPVMALPLFLLWAVSRGRWMGLGDPKLALGLGWLVGLSGSLLALFLAFVAGAALGGGAVLWGRLAARRGGLAMRSEVPFAPYLALGAAVAFATGWGAPEIMAAAERLTAPIVEPLVSRMYGA